VAPPGGWPRRPLVAGSPKTWDVERERERSEYCWKKVRTDVLERSLQRVCLFIPVNVTWPYFGPIVSFLVEPRSCFIHSLFLSLSLLSTLTLLGYMVSLNISCVLTEHVVLLFYVHSVNFFFFFPFFFLILITSPSFSAWLLVTG
jgi:hypothetical protein